MRIDLQDLIARAKALAEEERYEEAWQLVEPLTDRVIEEVDLARVWVLAASFSPLNDQIGETAAEIIARYGQDRDLVARAALLLTDVAEQRPMDLAPLANGPARIAADTFRQLLDEVRGQDVDRETVAALHSGLAMALRLTGSQDDDAAMAAMESALRLAPDKASLHFNLGLLHKWRGRWIEGMRANQRAIELGYEGSGVRWNLAICATAAGEHAVAGAMMRELEMKGDVGDDGRFVGTPEAVQVRVSGLGEGIDRAAHLLGSDPGFENLWIERDSLCTGKILSPTFYDLVVDYGDHVLFDGAPVGYRDDGHRRTPRFPLLQKLRGGAYRRYRFRARQPRAKFFESLTSRLPEETFFYVHDEQVNMLCVECVTGDRTQHQHEKRETFDVTGKFVVPEQHLTPALIPLLDELLADQAYVAIPQLYEDLGDHARARRDEERWADLAQAPDAKQAIQCATHGVAIVGYVCRHLVTGKNLGFLTSEMPGEEFPDAWCGDCDRVRIAEGGEWNERSEAVAEITMVCSHCYVAARERNRQRKKKWWRFGGR